MDMPNHLLASQVDHSLVPKLKTHTEPTLLVCDEIGYRRCQSLDLGPAFTLPVNSASNEKRILLRGVCRDPSLKTMAGF